MKVVFIANLINSPGGLQRMILYQANYFISKFNYDVEIILLDQKSNDSNTTYEVNKNIKLHYLDVYKEGFFSYYEKIKKVNRVLGQLTPDIVVVCFDEVFGLYLGRFIKKNFPLIYQRHTTNNLNFILDSKSKRGNILKSLKKLLIDRAGRGYDKFVILTEEHKKDWPHLNNLHVISNPITIDADSDKALLENRVVIAVGRQNPVKGYDMLLKSWQSVIKRHPNWKLKIYGKFNKNLNLQSQTEILDINSTVEFHQHTNDIKTTYLDVSLLVCSSRIEGFPLAIIEAMSLGVPAVSFDCPYGPRAIIKHGEDGLLVEPNDTEKLAEALITLIENKDLRKQMGQKAQVNIQRYAPNKIMQQWKALFESVLKE